jgi:FtsP/CotA-like multicopper oxidase with cupredoxin domain
VLRRIIIISLVAVAVLCTGVGGLLAWAWTSTSADSTVGKVAFEQPLRVPPLAESTVEGGKRIFTLDASGGVHDFGGGKRAETYGFNGDYLGPTLRATRGEQVVVNVHNGLNEATSAHWHGMHLPAAMDGGPHQPIAPGATWSPTWTVNQPAATLWYHPHPHGNTADHVYKGLAGMFIVDDPGTDVAALPHRYGVDDVPVIVQDKAFDDDGELGSDTGMFGSGGILGDTIVVNGTIGPYFDVTTEKVRLRLLNASNVRPYNFGFSDSRAFALVGTDGGLLDAPQETTGITMVPGERAEIVVTMRAGERVVLRSNPADLNLDWFHKRISGANDSFDVLQLRAAATLNASPAVPATMVATPRLDPAQANHTRELSLSGTSINGKKMDESRVDAAVTKDTVEVWKVTARDGELHVFHVHDVQFQVLSVGGEKPPPYLRGWKDTVFLGQGKEVVIIARFADYADPATPYMFHCHVLRHEDQGMMGQFVVIEPGQIPKLGAGHGDHD